jgi:hypothetical protein
MGEKFSAFSIRANGILRHLETNVHIVDVDNENNILHMVRIEN